MADTISVKNSAGTDVTVATNDALLTQLTAILAKIIAAPATEAKQDALIAKDFATQTTLAAVLAKLSADPATQTTLAAILAKLSSDPATDTGLAAIATLLAGTLDVSAEALPLPTGAATEASLNLVGTRAYDDASGQHVAFDGAAQSAAIAATEVTVVSSTDCYVAFGADPTASIGAGSMFLGAGVPFTRRITTGWKVSAIKASDAGTLSILPVA